MRDDELDRILSGNDEIVPSSGFAGEVMEGVRREASAPPAIPFPWKRALPGLAAWVVALVALIIAGVRYPWGESAGTALAVNSELTAIVDAAASVGVGWCALALLVSFVSVKLSMRLAGVGR